MGTLRCFLVAGLLLYSASARAETSRRVATLTTLFGGTLPAVMVGADRAWVPTLTTQVPLRLCAGTHCDAVRRVEQCTVPACPGTGALAVAEHHFADVSDYPTDRDGFAHERTLLSSEPGLYSILSMMAEHPQGTPPPPQHYEMDWLDDAFLGWRIEAGGGASVGFVASEGAAAVGGEARLAFRHTRTADGSDDAFLALMFGNSLGPELTLRGLALPGGNGGQAFTFGVDLAASYVKQHLGVRLPSIYSTLMPELGVALREGYAPAFYCGWSIPFAVLVDPRVAIDVRITGLIIDDWVPGDDVAFVGLFTLGVVVR